MKNRVVSLVLALTLCFAMACGSLTSASAEAAANLDTSKQIEIVMYALGTEPAGQQAIWDKLNELLLAKLNCTLKVNYIAFSDYPNKYPLLFSSGEVFDIAYTASWLNYASLAQRGAFMELDELWPAYAPNNYALASETAKKQAKLNGVTYCVPSLNRTYSAYGPIYRTDLVSGLGFDKDIATFEDVEEYCDLIKANYPEMFPISIYSMGSEIDDCFMYFNKMYPVTGAQGSFLWFDPSQSNPTVTTYYDYAKAPEFLEMVTRWNEKGFDPKSALSDTDAAKFKNGAAAMMFHNSDNFVSDVINYPDWNVKYANFATDVSNLSFTQDAMVISNTSKNPERAMALWDYLTTDEEAFTLFYYGIEGLSYALNDKGEVTMIDTDNYNTSSMWAVRNSNFLKNSAGTPDSIIEMRAAWDAQIDDKTNAQKYRSFVLDTSTIETEWTSCVNVHQQYWWPLELGYTEAVSGLAEYQNMMKAAGIDTVIAEVQRQLDEYVASLGE